jgi:hypothetical protein
MVDSCEAIPKSSSGVFAPTRIIRFSGPEYIWRREHTIFLKPRPRPKIKRSDEAGSLIASMILDWKGSKVVGAILQKPSSCMQHRPAKERASKADFVQSDESSGKIRIFASVKLIWTTGTFKSPVYHLRYSVIY